MLIHKVNKQFMSRSDKPNENWINDDNYFVVPDNSDLYHKILEFADDFELVLNEKNELVDVKRTEKTRIQQIDEELEKIDKETGMTRILEDIIDLTKIYLLLPQTTKDLIDRKKALREELKTLTGGDLSAKNNTNEQ